MMSKKITIPKKPNSDREIDDILDQWVKADQPSETKKPDLKIAKSINQNDYVQCNILLPKELHQKIKVYCAANGLKISEKIREIIESHNFE